MPGAKGMLVAVAVLALGLAASPAIEPVGQGRGAAPGGGLYDRDPNHIWNRVHRLLHVRVATGGAEYGEDELDPLLWESTQFLIAGSSHDAAMRALDEFLASHAERLVRDPLKRAVFQHDLWAVFDWLADRFDDRPEARRPLAARLVQAMRRVALTNAEIAALPDNCAAAVSARAFSGAYDDRDRRRPFLPADLNDPKANWVRLTGYEPSAPQHAGTFSHSDFSVLLKVPGAGTLAYLEQLWNFPEPYVAEPFFDGEQRVAPNPALPQLPLGTEVALVRTMLLVDTDGRIARTRLTESVQLRVFHEGAPRPDGSLSYHDQEFFEFRTLRRGLFEGKAGGFHAITPDEPGFLLFSSKGIDNFERPSVTVPQSPILSHCVNCHPQRNIQSIASLRRLLKPYVRLDYRHPRWSVYATPGVDAKVHRFDWGLLRSFWEN